MTQDLYVNSFTMFMLSLMLYFTTGHTKVLGHASPPKPSLWGKSYLNWRKWIWPWF